MLGRAAGGEEVAGPVPCTILIDGERAGSIASVREPYPPMAARTRRRRPRGVLDRGRGPAPHTPPAGERPPRPDDARREDLARRQRRCRGSPAPHPPPGAPRWSRHRPPRPPPAPPGPPPPAGPPPPGDHPRPA